jgi:hypothetical protein
MRKNAIHSRIGSLRRGRRGMYREIVRSDTVIPSFSSSPCTRGAPHVNQPDQSRQEDHVETGKHQHDGELVRSRPGSPPRSQALQTPDLAGVRVLANDTLVPPRRVNSKADGRGKLAELLIS